ncbi:hypothetical protein [Streptomyces sp. NRRL WC-3618]|uniref:hypothetical protein n=1 Tax=Streptomyces sp. NRRL WC-3618 TaxID=1519490 RepID=UPI000AC5711C|nr:hypothetical protein [Streptomyces sp. NRRL WC-3618]
MPARAQIVTDDEARPPPAPGRETVHVGDASFAAVAQRRPVDQRDRKPRRPGS